jgi:hypothetical protein
MAADASEVSSLVVGDGELAPSVVSLTSSVVAPGAVGFDVVEFDGEVTSLESDTLLSTGRVVLSESLDRGRVFEEESSDVASVREGRSFSGSSR